ncbi:hypothetical protein COT72_01715 [archaeon CG10_big_fil_rev_8_21_14_0_10_43_11]|nr:MAG: hypothetical protein COT72_01715 [archaeon CG10_big_fil_rev_8_21_14_0_10_43_11]
MAKKKAPQRNRTRAKEAVIKSSQKLKLQVGTKELKDLKATILTLVTAIVFIGLCTMLLLATKNPLGAYFLAVGEIAFVLALIYELKQSTRALIKEHVKKSRVFELVSDLIFTLSTAFVIFSLFIAILALKVVIMHSPDQLKTAAIIAIPLLAVPLLLWDSVFDYFKNHMNKFRWFFILLLLPTLFAFAHGFNVSTIDDAVSALSNTQEILNTTSSVFAFAGNASSFLGQQKQVISEALGLSDTQTNIALGIIILLALIIAMNFLESIAKWLILILIAVFIFLLL